MPTRRTVIAGAALTGVGWAALHNPAPVLAAVDNDGGYVTPPLLARVESVVRQAQHLDDRQGGAGRGFVADQFTAVARLLRRASYDADTGRRLAAALAQLAQTVGFMAFDSDEDGVAQRWYLTGLRAAHAANDRGLAASILALMSNQAADRGHALDAQQLAAAAEEAAADSPAVVRSLVAARGSFAHAAAGDPSGFLRARESTLELLGTQDRPPPAWASYTDPIEVDAITGRGLVVLADRLPARRDRLLRQATQLLHARAHTDPNHPQQRSALRHGAWLAIAHTATKDLDLAVATTRLTMERLPAVSSARSVNLLRRLHDDLAPAANTPAVHWLLGDLRRHLDNWRAG